jgi:hypothetical protein
MLKIEDRIGKVGPLFCGLLSILPPFESGGAIRLRLNAVKNRFAPRGKK